MYNNLKCKKKNAFYSIIYVKNNNHTHTHTHTTTIRIQVVTYKSQINIFYIS